MGFSQIDGDAYAADESLSAAVLRQAADNGIYAHGESTRGCAMAWDYRYPPLLHSIPRGNDGDIDPDSEPGWMRFLWRPARRVTSLSVRVRATRYVGAVTLGLHILPLDDLISGREIGDPKTTASAGSGEATTSLLATGLSVTPGRLYAVIVSARSVLGSAVDGWYDHNGGTPGSALNSWRPAAFLGIKDAAASNTYWRPSGGAYTDFATRIQPYVIEWVSGSDPFTATYSTAKTGPVSPAGRLLRREQDSDQGHASGGVATTFDACYVWPPIDEDVALALTISATDWIRRTEISYLELHGVQITEGVEALDGVGASVAPDQAASARAVASVDRYARRCVSGHPRVWAIAPSPSYDDADAGIGYKQHAGASIDITTSYQTIGEYLVGDPNRYSRGATDYAQCKYRIALELHMPCFGAQDGQKGPITLQFSITERDGSTSPATVVETTIEGAPVTPVRNDDASADAGFWLAGYPPYVTDRTPHRHSTQGMWCASAWRSARPIVVEVVVPDDSANGANQGRLLKIEAKRGATVDYPAARAHLYLDALSITALPGLDENAGEEI